jgi:chemotaxis protein MotB
MMRHRKKEPDADEAAGAPEWMVTFSDCMTLLLTFFVLLLSFSSFDEKVFQKLRVIFADAMPAVSIETQGNRDAFLPTKQILPTEELDDGSEKPTLEKGDKDYFKEDTDLVDFHSRKVFVIASKKIFWGKGIAISFQGRKTLSALASFLKEVPNRVVISENGQENVKTSEHFGLPRAWAVMEHLTTKYQVDKKRFSISAASTITQEDFEQTQQKQPTPESERTLEIVLLERSIYN